MTMTGGEHDKHGQNIGKHIDYYNQVETRRAAVLVVEGEIAALLKDSDDEAVALGSFLGVTRNDKTGMTSTKASIVRTLTSYMKGELEKDLDFVGTATATALLVALAEDMVEAAETVLECAVAATTPTYDAQNAGTVAISAPTVTELVKTETFELEVVSVPSAGAEIWKAGGSLAGSLSVRPTTGGGEFEYVNSKSPAQLLFTATITAYTAGTGNLIAGATDVEMATFVFTGAVKGITGATSPNTDAQGDVYVDLDRLTAGESGDNNNQLSDWANITGLVMVKNTDTDGKLHASIIDDGGGFFHVGFFKDVARAAGDLVAHTGTYNGGGAQAIIADNSSGLGGTITIDAVVAVDVDIYYTYAFDRVRAYKESGKSNLVCAGGLVGGGATTLYETNSSGLAGTVTVTYSDGEADWQIRIGFALVAGDKIYIPTTSDDAGVFQTFMRDAYGVILPSASSGNETYDEAWAT